MEILVLVLAGALAFANGANDNGKGVATLVGHGTASERAALLWAAATTALGAGVGALAGSGLARVFRTAFVEVDGGPSLAFFAAALAAALAWVLFATRTGLPVSTTHALAGGLVGSGLVEVGAAGVGWAALGERVALPLAASPLLALVLVYVASPRVEGLARRLAPRCICAIAEPGPGAVGPGSAATAVPRLALVTGTEAQCRVHSPVAAARGASLLSGLHWSTSGLVGFARGWNDAPKIAALALAGGAAAGSTFALVVAAMAAGGLLAGRRVLRMLAHRITPLPLAESLAASGVASVLVALASWRSLPVSTTHVTTGGIVGAGLARSAREVGWRSVRDIGLSWVVTFPAAALAAALARALVG
jgi:PiT family inorganic phosphate transporter